MGKERPRRRRRGLSAWQVAGIVLGLGVVGLASYALWPAIFGTDDEEAREVGDDLETARAEVDAIVLQPVSFPIRAEAPGHLAPWRRAEISAEASGIIMARPIEEGQYVQAGTILLEIDDSEQQIRLQEARAALLKAQADYAVYVSSSGDLPQADTTDLAIARNQLQQAQAGFEQGTTTANELQKIRRRFESLNVLSGNLRDEVQAVANNLVAAEQQVARAELDLRRTQLRAPFSGRIADLEVEAGQHIGAGTKVLVLLEDDRMKVQVDVLEGDFVHMRTGASANVTVPNFSAEVFQGAVYTINPTVDPAKGAGRVTVSVPNPGGRLVAGLHADVAVETRRLQERLVVPTDALLVRAGRDLVFKIREGRGYWTYVTVGARSGNFAEITGAGGTNIVEPGDSILVAGHWSLAHDSPITVVHVRELGLQ